HFGDDQRVLSAMVTTLDAAAGFLERVIQVGTSGAQGRNQAEEHSDENRNSQREKQDRRAQTDFLGARQSFGQGGKTSTGSPCGKQHAKRATEEREKDTFGEELANDADAASAKRGANAEFPSAAGGTRKKKVRDVGTGDQEDEGH